MIVLTDDEKALIASGKLDPNDILVHRKKFPVRSIDLNELDLVKDELKKVNLLYRDAIARNKELYDLLVDNRRVKEELRDKIQLLRLKKKKLLGFVP